MTKKRLTFWGGGLILGLSVFYCAVCSPVSVWANGDILIAETVFPTVWDLFQTLIAFSIYWIAIAFLILLSHGFDLRGTMPFFGCYCLAALIRYFGSLLIGTLMMNQFSDREVFFENLAYSGLDILLDLVQFAVIFLLIYLLFLRKSTAKMRAVLFETPDWFKHPNRLSGTVLSTIAVPSLVRLFSRIVYDISWGSAESTVDLFWMIFFYATDIISIVCGYFAVVFLLRIQKIPQKKEEDFLSGHFSDTL